MPKPTHVIPAVALSLCASLLMAEEQLVFTPPEGFSLAFESSTPELSISEYTPSGALDADWTRLVTRTTAPGKAGLPAELVAEQIANTVAANCPGAGVQMVASGLQNNYGVAVFFTQCPNSPLGEGIPETAAIKVLVGAQASYTVQYAWRGPFTREQVLEHTLWLRGQLLCDTKRPGSPCPTP
ncbi:hypothetical protein [Primorskyibacter sp. S187A]|uniref:hypothetical protein n=1 Tax=Primorskyibacter sp. S187A TaxID=3415130 RepID=UPI003C79A52A